MALYGLSANTSEGTRFFAIEADDAAQARANLTEITGPLAESDIQAFQLEDLLNDQFSGFAELTTF